MHNHNGINHNRPAPAVKISLLGTNSDKHIAIPVHQFTELHQSVQDREAEIIRLRRALAVCQTTITCIVALRHEPTVRRQVDGLSLVAGMALRAAGSGDTPTLPDAKRDEMLTLAEAEASAAGAQVVAQFVPRSLPSGRDRSVQKCCPECSGDLAVTLLAPGSYGRRCNGCGLVVPLAGVATATGRVQVVEVDETTGAYRIVGEAQP